MKKYLLITCLITILLACTERKKTQNSNQAKKADSVSSVVDTVNYNDITSFGDYYKSRTI
jgi:protein involved in sex pheromone biosynthesis